MLSTGESDDYLQVALEAVDLGEAIIADTVAVTACPKGERDEVTPTDLAVEDALRVFLLRRTKTAGFHGEERGVVRPDARLRWILDPVDGTVNYARGLPLFGLSLALAQGNRPLLGVILLPGAGTRYWAVAGRGAWRDGQPISASAVTGLADAVIAVGDFATGDGADARNAPRLELVRRLAARAMRVRMLGTAAGDLAWVADGRLAAMCTLANLPWDMAAGACIAAEAGAAVTDAQGRPWSLDSAEIIAGAPAVVAEIAAIVRRARSAAVCAGGAR